MTPPLRVLLVEDSATDAKLVVNALQKIDRPIEHLRVDDAPSMRDALRTARWDVVLSDWSMPKLSALRALEVLKESGLDVPFLIVSGTIGEEQAADAMRAGAMDYVHKDRLARLAPAVERELREQRDRVARREAEEALRASEARFIGVEAEVRKQSGALRLSEARFARLADSGVIGVVSADVRGKVHDANDAFLHMVGYSREELRAGAIDWSVMTPVEWRDADVRALEQLKTAGVTAPWEKEYVHKDGRRVPILLGVAMVEHPECITFVIDLTDRKRAEALLRDAELQLRQSQKMEAIGRLAGGVAHDFNNVLSVVLSYAEMLIADRAQGDPVRDDLEEIRRAGRRAAGLTRQLLLFSRQQVVEPRSLDLNDVLSGMRNMLGRLVGEDVEVTSVQGHALGRVSVDPGSIEQVIMNLAVNARDAMPDGGKLTFETTNVALDEAYARTHLGARPGPHVLLSVTDSGTGMDDATLARIFEPFFTTKEAGKGTGLGLSTLFGIVQQSEGHVRVESELGKGTTFRVYFPRERGDKVAAPSEAAPPVANERGSETVLLVEDDDQVRALARNVLRRAGYVVLDASNGSDALLLCERHTSKIDLLLTDVVLPRMNGREMAERLATTRPDMKVLFMSGYTQDAILQRGVRESEVAYLQKPFTPDSLTRRVREALRE